MEVLWRGLEGEKNAQTLFNSAGNSMISSFEVGFADSNDITSLYAFAREGRFKPFLSLLDQNVS